MEVKFFRFGERLIAFDIAGVALFEVDEDGRRALRDHARDVSVEALAEMRDLRRRGFFPSCPEAAKPSKKINVRHRVQSITLGLTHECNLRCGYCFGQRYLQVAPEPREQLLGVGRACLRLLHANWRRSRRREPDRSSAGCGEAPSQTSFNLVFFGGEPLLRFEVLKELVGYGRDLFRDAPERLSFGLTTNALALDQEKAVWMRDHGLTPLVSVDGFGAAHDFYRRDARGRGTFQPIRRNLETARRVGLPFGARVTITNRNVDLVGMMRRLDPIGFFSYKFCPLCGLDRFALTPENQRRLARSYRRLGDLFLSRLQDEEPIRFDAFDHCLQSLADCRRSPWCCDAGVNEISVDPAGRVFSCYKLAAEPEAKLGTIWDDALWVRRPNLDRAERVEHIPECSRCWIRNVCSGGCFADRYVSSKYGQARSFQAHCSLNRIVMLEAVRIYDQALRRCPKSLDRYLSERS